MTWYNHEHHLCGLGLHTPSDVHHGHAGAVREARAKILDQAYREHPERFVHQPPQLPAAAWINKPPAEEPTKEPPTEDSDNPTQ